MFRKRRDQAYLDWCVIDKKLDFTKIDKDNVLDYITHVVDYINTHRESHYSYLLAKDLILGIRRSLLHQEITVLYDYEHYLIMVFERISCSIDEDREKKLVNKAVNLIWQNMPKPKLTLGENHSGMLLLKNYKTIIHSNEQDSQYVISS